MKTLEFEAPALRQWLKLSVTTRERIGAKLALLVDAGVGDVRQLKGRSGSRLRVGAWRVLFVDNGVVIKVYAVGHRRDVYD